MSMDMPTADPEPVPTGSDLPSRVTRLGVPLSPPFRQLGQVLLVAASAVAAYFLISRFLLQSVEVVGVSMLPTLQQSQRYLLNRWIYHLRPPRRGEVVVIRDPVDHGLSVKRVVGIAGDDLYLKGGCVYNHGRPFQEPYLSPGTRTFPDIGLAEQKLLCGAGQYLVLGDNRANSTDSRAYGPISARNVIGLIRP